MNPKKCHFPQNESIKHYLAQTYTHYVFVRFCLLFYFLFLKFLGCKFHLIVNSFSVTFCWTSVFSKQNQGSAWTIEVTYQSTCTFPFFHPHLYDATGTNFLTLRSRPNYFLLNLLKIKNNKCLCFTYLCFFLFPNLTVCGKGDNNNYFLNRKQQVRLGFFVW